MQEQKINYSLILSSEYEIVRFGLYKNREQVEVQQEHKLTASKNLMLLVTTMLKKHNVSWVDLAFVGVNQGPSPFTTLRVVITTVNGLLFALKVPIIGIDGLKTFVNSTLTESGVMIALLNAFNHDVYFAIQLPDGSIRTGWDFHATFFQQAALEFKDQQVTFIGNAVAGYREVIQNLFTDAQFPDPMPAMVTLEAVAAAAWDRFEKGDFQTEPLLPLYLKTIEYKQSM